MTPFIPFQYFETVTECYKMKMKKVELEIQMLKEKKDKVYTTISLFPVHHGSLKFSFLSCETL